jgi:hypothetical protein
MSAVHFIDSRRETAAEFGDGASLLKKRNYKASFALCMFPYMHDSHEYIVEISTGNSVAQSDRTEPPLQFSRKREYCRRHAEIFGT